MSYAYKEYINISKSQVYITFKYIKNQHDNETNMTSTYSKSKPENIRKTPSKTTHTYNHFANILKDMSGNDYSKDDSAGMKAKRYLILAAQIRLNKREFKLLLDNFA